MYEMCVCVCVCVRACVRACVRVCVCVLLALSPPDVLHACVHGAERYLSPIISHVGSRWRKLKRHDWTTVWLPKLLI